MYHAPSKVPFESTHESLLCTWCLVPPLLPSSLSVQRSTLVRCRTSYLVLPTLYLVHCTSYKKKPFEVNRRASIMWRRPTLPGVTPVPSALQGLTSLFGMGRGGTPALGRLNLCKTFRAENQEPRLIVLLLIIILLLLVSCF